MDARFASIAVASALHLFEEYVVPGGFLRWLRRAFPSGALGPLGAICVNVAFIALILSPLISDPKLDPVFNISIVVLVISNGALHFASSLVTTTYSPGVITSVLLYFPIGAWALVTIAHDWRIDTEQLVAASLLGVFWQVVPIAIMVVRGSLAGRQ
ncbi:HXXEE domain-containing protein [Lichenicoccus sp.]|uniref:HXXEE domain-containing protein n=1 Tax=Lichenicoccus sp. TaxID=2781899 RepID=UPI003D1397E5